MGIVNFIDDTFSNAISQNKKFGPITFLVLQPTPFCNLRCKYCYLTEESRSTRKFMPINMVRDIIDFVVKSNFANNVLVIKWHAGEPMAAGLKFYQEAVDIISKVTKLYNIKAVHTIQTNATLINEDWANFFKDNKFVVGISLDGPENLHNLNRVSANGKGTFDLVMKKIQLLKKHQISFRIISVLSNTSLDDPDMFFDFFKKLGAHDIGLNIEETEGNNKSSSINNVEHLKKYAKFFSRILQLQKGTNVIFREINERKEAIINGSEYMEGITSKPFFMLNVDYLGNFSTFCPELLDIKFKGAYSDFILGNIYEHSISEVISSQKFQNIYNNIQKGIKLCKETCSYFSLCGGGSPVNKLCENGDFNSGSTFFCKTKIQIPVNILLSELKNNLSEQY